MTSTKGSKANPNIAKASPVNNLPMMLRGRVPEASKASRLSLDDNEDMI